MQQRAKRQRAAATSSLADLHTKELAMTMGDELGPKKGPRKGPMKDFSPPSFATRKKNGGWVRVLT